MASRCTLKKNPYFQYMFGSYLRHSTKNIQQLFFCYLKIKWNLSKFLSVAVLGKRMLQIDVFGLSNPLKSCQKVTNSYLLLIRTEPIIYKWLYQKSRIYIFFMTFFGHAQGPPSQGCLSSMTEMLFKFSFRLIYQGRSGLQ